MIELIDNLIQMSIMAVIFSISFFRGFFRTESNGRRKWILTGLFVFEYFLGDLYSVLYLIFYNETPHYFYIAEISWYAAFLFMILLLVNLSERVPLKETIKAHPLFLIIPAFTVTMAVIFFVRNGDLIGNIICVVIMTVLIWLAASGKGMIFKLCLVIAALEYALWISSSFYWPGDTLGNPYFWIDTMLSVSLLWLIPAVGRAVKK